MGGGSSKNLVNAQQAQNQPVKAKRGKAKPPAPVRAEAHGAKNVSPLKTAATSPKSQKVLTNTSVSASSPKGPKGVTPLASNRTGLRPPKTSSRQNPDELKKLEEQEEMSMDQVLAQQYKAYAEQQNRLKSAGSDGRSSAADDPEAASLEQQELQQYKAYAAAQDKAAAMAKQGALPAGAAQDKAAAMAKQGALPAASKVGPRGGKPKQPLQFSPESGTQEDRDTISCVVPGKLYLTNFRGVGRPEELEALGIKHIVCVNQQDNEYPDRFNYFNIDNLEDQEDHDATQHFSSVAKFTDDALAKGGAVCFHCAAGISRSSTMLIAYLMTSRKMSLLDAFAMTYKARRVTWPNRTFMMQLIQYESKLQAKGKLPGKTPSLTMEQWDAWNCSGDELASKEASLCDRTASLKGRDSLQFRLYQDSVLKNLAKQH